MYLKIAEVNADPTAHGYKSKKYGRKERKSSYKRIFKTLGDYSFDAYQKALVDPTIKKFKNPKELLIIDELAINNNNISHTERLGLLLKDGKQYQLSPLGKKYFNNEVVFEELFKNQMLKYFSIESDKDGKRILFPYRACLKLLLNLKSINFIEFVFGIYSMIDSSSESIVEALEGISHLRDSYPNIEITNKSNKKKVLDELNEYFETNYSITDVWEKKTTVNNQFIYFRNHLSLLKDLIEVDTKSIKLIPNKEVQLRTLLSKDEALENEENESNLKEVYCGNLLIFVAFSLLK